MQALRHKNGSDAPPPASRKKRADAKAAHRPPSPGKNVTQLGGAPPAKRQRSDPIAAKIQKAKDAVACEEEEQDIADVEVLVW